MLPKMRTVLVTVFVLGCVLAVVVHTHPAGSKTKSPEVESLPPDTFRKLAQALYQRGDKAENRLQRKFFYNDNITCNDGTVAGYYIRRNYTSKRWIIFLEGGWICHDDISCAERRNRENHRMSSDRWPSVQAVGGILSADPAENPHFADANHVFVPYCSSDAWAGYSKAKRGKGNLSFMGGYIVREVIRELADFQQLLVGRELYLAGSSAGGIGVMMNVDTVAAMVSQTNLKVRGIVDSGWFVDNDPFSAMECGSGKCSVIQNLQRGVMLWNARVPTSCQNNYPGEAWRCFLGYRLYPFLKTPLFIFQWQFDKFQLYADNVPIPASQDQWHYIHEMGTNLRGTFHNLSAVFSPACIAHEVITKVDWTTVNVEGVTLPDALNCWASSLPDYIPDFSNELGDKDLLGTGNDVLMSGNNRPRSVSMLADEPLTSFKTGSNLVRAIDTVHADSTRNSISTRLQKNRDMESNRDDRQLELSTNTRIGSSNGSGGSSNREQRRRRVRRLRQRCRQSDNEACQKLKKLGYEPEADSETEEGESVNNRDLVRSLDRRRTKRRQHLKNKTKKSEVDEESKKLAAAERKSKRQQARRERRRKKKERREKKLVKRQRRKELKEKAQKAAETEEARHHLNVRSVVSNKCQTKLVDSCTWPHCNRSCPKLKNPETGQDIDFLTLLQSFGLDMSSVASALGMDLMTVNNMDREELIHLLTSQGGTD